MHLVCVICCNREALKKSTVLVYISKSCLLCQEANKIPSRSLDRLVKLTLFITENLGTCAQKCFAASVKMLSVRADVIHTHISTLWQKGFFLNYAICICTKVPFSHVLSHLQTLKFFGFYWAFPARLVLAYLQALLFHFKPDVTFVISVLQQWSIANTLFFWKSLPSTRQCTHGSVYLEP